MKPASFLRNYNDCAKEVSRVHVWPLVKWCLDFASVVVLKEAAEYADVQYLVAIQACYTFTAFR